MSVITVFGVFIIIASCEEFDPLVEAGVIATPSSTPTPTPGHKMYWTINDGTKRGVYRSDPDGANQEQIIQGGTTSFTYLSIDSVNKWLFYVTANSLQIVKTDLNGENPTILVARINPISGLYADGTLGYVFWTETEAPATRIYRISIDGSSGAVLVYTGTGTYYDVVYDQLSGTVRWLGNNGTYTRIWKVNIDGSGFFENSDYFNSPCTGIGINSSDGNVYFNYSSAGIYGIRRIAASGTSLTQPALVYSLGPSGATNDLVIYSLASKLYCTTATSIISVNMDGSGSATILSGQLLPFGIDFYYP